MSWNKLTMARAAVGALLVGSAPGGKRSVGITAVATPNGTSPTVLYNYLAPTFALSAALISSSTNLNSATLAAASTGDIQIPFIGITVGDLVDVNPNFAPPVGVTWAGYTVAATSSSVSARANSTAYIVGQVFKVTQNAVTYAFSVTTAGTTAGSAPTYNVTPGAVTTDGTAVVTCLGTAVAQLRIHNATASGITVSGNLNGNWVIEWHGLAP